MASKRFDAVRQSAAKKAALMLKIRHAETATKQAAMLEQFRASGEIGPSCRAVGIHRDTHYNWLKADEQYAKDFAEATVMRVEVLETEARRRALIGWDEPVYYKGKAVGSIRKFSDTLLIFTLKGEKPEKYRERFEHSGPKGGPIETTVTRIERIIVDPQESTT